jgi:hypothetical protein
MKQFVLVAAFAVLVGGVAVAAIPIAIPDFTVTSGTPYVHMESVTAGQTVYGLNFVADWTAGPGNPWSSELEVLVTPPVGAPFDWDPIGGQSSGDPYQFNATQWPIWDPGIGSDGTWEFSFDTSYAGSTANLANVTMTLITDPVTTTCYIGDTTGAPTWNRPSGPTFTSLSTFATATPYDAMPFTVDTTGTYQLSSDQSSGQPEQWDGYLFLYQGAFDPMDPLTNGIAGDDDGPGGIGTSLIENASLTAGELYYLVTTGYDNDDFGPFENCVIGPGTATFIPEPAALLLLVVGGLALRRR